MGEIAKITEVKDSKKVEEDGKTKEDNKIEEIDRITKEIVVIDSKLYQLKIKTDIFDNFYKIIILLFIKFYRI